MKMTNSQDIARILLEIKAVTLSPEKPYKYASGIFSPIYTDNRLLMGYPEKRNEVIGSFEKMIKEKHIESDVIAGVASSGIPHGAWLADRLDKPFVYVRKASKEHGKENLIEGVLGVGQKVILVEDLISTGGSSLAAIEAIRTAGGFVDTCLAIFTYNMKKAVEGFRAADILLYALTDFPTLIEVAADEGFIERDAAAKAIQWNQDPSGWGEKMGFE
ncbi:MAG: orotate phosphoribosyltransferase [Candidatus Altiarchaeota archaeon]